MYLIFINEKNYECVDNEGLDGENWSWRGEGKWKRAVRESSSSWVHLRPFKLAVLDIFAALALKQAGKTLLCCVLGDLKVQEEHESQARSSVRGGEQGRKSLATKEAVWSRGHWNWFCYKRGPATCNIFSGVLCRYCQPVGIIVACECLQPSSVPQFCRLLPGSQPTPSRSLFRGALRWVKMWNLPKRYLHFDRGLKTNSTLTIIL